jgi:TolA-binding protein
MNLNLNNSTKQERLEKEIKDLQLKIKNLENTLKQRQKALKAEIKCQEELKASQEAHRASESQTQKKLDLVLNLLLQANPELAKSLEDALSTVDGNGEGEEQATDPSPKGANPAGEEKSEDSDGQ